MRPKKNRGIRRLGECEMSTAEWNTWTLDLSRVTSFDDSRETDSRMGSRVTRGFLGRSSKLPYRPLIERGTPVYTTITNSFARIEMKRGRGQVVISSDMRFEDAPSRST